MIWYQVTTFPLWVKGKVDEIIWCFSSNEIHFVHQLHWSLVLLPLHNQLTLRNPLTWFKLIYVLPGDLKVFVNSKLYWMKLQYILQPQSCSKLLVHYRVSLTVGWENGAILQPSLVTSPSSGMPKVISLRSNLTRSVASFLAKWP